jgi:hypothetical protein
MANSDSGIIAYKASEIQKKLYCPGRADNVG